MIAREHSISFCQLFLNQSKCAWQIQAGKYEVLLNYQHNYIVSIYYDYS